MKPLDLDVALGYVGGDRELLVELLAIFVEEAPRRIAELRDAVARGDPRAVMVAAHTLKGTLCVLGAEDAAAAAARLEVRGREHRLEDVAPLAGALEREVLAAADAAAAGAGQ